MKPNLNKASISLLSDNEHKNLDKVVCLRGKHKGEEE